MILEIYARKHKFIAVSHVIWYVVEVPLTENLTETRNDSSQFVYLIIDSRQFKPSIIRTSRKFELYNNICTAARKILNTCNAHFGTLNNCTNMWLARLQHAIIYSFIKLSHILYCIISACLPTAALSDEENIWSNFKKNKCLTTSEKLDGYPAHLRIRRSVHKGFYNVNNGH